MQSRASLSRLLMPLAALAFLVQLAVPYGWMIGQSGNGLVALTPCPSASPRLAQMATPSAGHTALTTHAKHGDHGARAEHHPHQAHSNSPVHRSAGKQGSHDKHTALESVVCDFASLSFPATLPDPPAVEPVAPASPEIVPGVALSMAPGRGLAAPPPPSTGPPHIA
ncbi:hypothetical protein [Qipengyuania sp. NPDC077563]|uniref:hypothetical protein n=1 Tax=Qipengyuania sp. NPDC077563 TaxID=3364497 RepID=UPI0038505BD8